MTVQGIGCARTTIPTTIVVATTNCIQGNKGSLKEKRKQRFQMGKFCSSDQIMKNRRRINGLQLPLNWQQIVCWIVLLITASINLSIISLIQFPGLRIISLITFSILYASHLVSHIAALIIDPAEEDLRNRDINEVPEFDRSLHAHVIENGRCHLCNLYTSNKKTKHCGLCNKCVYEFDHHCKWLNNCIGQRNYVAFIGCVTTALFISTFTFVLCIVDIIWFFQKPELLSPEAQQFLNCNSSDALKVVKFCKSSISFLTLLIILCISGIALTCALLHLCCFHIYISLLGVSTYEYIVRNSNSKVKCCRLKLKGKSYSINTKKEKDVPNISNMSENRKKLNALNTNRTNVVNLINVLIENDLNKAINKFSPDNKIHPHQDSVAS